MKYTPSYIVEESLFYSIPIYQRLFEWNPENVETLLEDLKKVFEYSHGEDDYYIGMLTSTKDKELVDGQQRFTVMMLMGCVFQNYYHKWRDFLIIEGQIRLHFVARSQDEAYMQGLINGENNASNFINYKMQIGKKTICDFMEKLAGYSDEKKEDFAKYVFNHMSFFISELPSDYSPRDLNKYFERMNTTGKNLEQHEILKVKLLSNLSSDVSMYMTLWNKLADVDTLLIRKRNENDNIVQRKRDAFTNNIITIANNAIINGLGNIDNESAASIASIPPSSKSPANEIEYTKDSHCALTFPYILLQTLYWKLGGKIKSNISDFFKPNNLLETFEKHLPYEGNNVSEEDIKDFMERLVKCRLALDICFVRPSDYGYSLDMNLNEDNDSLKKLSMLESMLYVSSSNYTHYRWFGWLMNSIEKHNGIPDANELYNELKSEDNKANSLPPYESLSYSEETRYWFWRLDLYIWEHRKELFKDNKDSKALSVAENYIFRRNRSIEHIAPQTPLSNSMMVWDKDSNKDIELMNSFGNLVMISQGLNSSLKNESYEVKRAHVESFIKGSKSGSIESLKLLIVHQENETWNRDTIVEHGKKMYEMLKNSY